MTKSRLLVTATAVGLLLMTGTRAQASAIGYNVTISNTVPALPTGVNMVNKTYIGDTLQQLLTVPNTANPNNTKTVWLEVYFSAAQGGPTPGAVPQNDGDKYDSTDPWPDIDGGPNLNTSDNRGYTEEVTQVDVIAPPADFTRTYSSEYIMVETITPQPSFDTIFFPDAWWEKYGSQVEYVQVVTACNPTPDLPSQWALLSLPLLCAVDFGRRQRRQCKVG